MKEKSCNISKKTEIHDVACADCYIMDPCCSEVDTFLVVSHSVYLLDKYATIM